MFLATDSLRVEHPRFPSVCGALLCSTVDPPPVAHLVYPQRFESPPRDTFLIHAGIQVFYTCVCTLVEQLYALLYILYDRTGFYPPLIVVL